MIWSQQIAIVGRFVGEIGNGAFNKLIALHCNVFILPRVKIILRALWGDYEPTHVIAHRDPYSQTRKCHEDRQGYEDEVSHLSQ